MSEEILIGLASIIILGIASQWVAWRVKLPSILLLLIAGFVAGPATGFIDPDSIFSGLLFPVVSISVAIILFEGGLSLSIAELKATGTVVHRLISLGAMITWLLTALIAHYYLGLELPLAVLLGAILVVSGPTVVIPLIHHVRPVGSVSSVLRWEGILIDPIGAVLAVLVYEVVTVGAGAEITTLAVTAISKTVLAGAVTGGLGALIIVYLLYRYWIPDFLQSPVTLMTAIASYTISNHYQAESGLLAVTVMGIAMANQKSVSVKHIFDFVENLRVLLLSALFILLAARLELSDLLYLNSKTFVFLLLLIVVVRPLTVLASSAFTGLKWSERAFLSLVYPRGIVAAAVASVFALRMVEAGYKGAAELVPLTFFVIVGTVAVYGLGAPVIARLLKVAQPNPQGVLMVGAGRWSIEIAKALKDEGFHVLLSDTNRQNIYTARLAGIPTYHGSVLSESAVQKLSLAGIGRLMAMTSNDGVNSLAALHFSEIFGSSEVYQLVPSEQKRLSGEEVSMHLRGRFLFSEGIDVAYLAKHFRKDGVIKKSRLTEEFDFDSFRSLYGESAVPLFIINEDRELLLFTRDAEIVPKPGQTIFSLVDSRAGEESVPIDLIDLGEKKKTKPEPEDDSDGDGGSKDD